MNFVDVLTNAGDGAVVRQVGSQLGLDDQQAKAGLAALTPLLTAAIQRHLGTPDRPSTLVSVLSEGNHERFLSDPAALDGEIAVTEGNGILGHVLGSKDASRAVAAHAAAQTGLGEDVLKRMLPLAATLMMGAFAQQKGSTANASLEAPSGGGSLADVLGGLADRNHDGSVADDVVGMFGRLLNRA